MRIGVAADATAVPPLPFMSVDYNKKTESNVHRVLKYNAPIQPNTDPKVRLGAAEADEQLCGSRRYKNQHLVNARKDKLQFKVASCRSCMSDFSG